MKPEAPYLGPGQVPDWARARKVWERAQTAGAGRAWPEHVGAWLDRMLDEPITAGKREQDSKHAERLWLYHDAVAALRIGTDPGLDPGAVQTWRALYGRHARTFAVGSDPAVQRHVTTLETTTRVLLHAATERTVTEGSVLLHHTYGVPYLPGSALKGALRGALSGRRKHFDLSNVLMNGNADAVDVLLGKGNTGTDDHAGLVDVLDALWMPERPTSAAGSWSPLALDVVTPHHVNAEREAPTDLDAPVPTHRLTLAPGCRFRVVLEAGPAFPAAWLRWLGDEVLPEALSHDGLGAWTSAGYGRLRAVSASPQDSGVATTSTVNAPNLEQPRPAEVWCLAELELRANTGELIATLADRRQGRASAQRSIQLLAALPEADVKELRGKRRLKVEVLLEAVGKGWSLLAARPRERG